MKNLSFFKKLALGVTALVATLGITVGASALAGVTWNGAAKTTERPAYSVYFSKNDPSGATTEQLSDLNVGDTIHVFLSVENKDAANPIEKLQMYAPFSHRGIFTWIKADDFGRQTSSNKPSISLSNGRSLQYEQASTQIATNESGSWVVTSADDYSAGNSKLFSDSSSDGFFLNNVKGGTLESGAKVNYIVKYRLKVVDGNTATFNQHSGDDKTFMVRRRGDSAWQTSLEGFTAGDRLEFRVYVHNNTRGTIALNTKVGVENWPMGVQKESTIRGFVDADNANRATSEVTLKDDQDFQLVYRADSTRFSGQPSMNQGFFLTDEVRPEGITSPAGILIGEGDVGAIDGCWDFLVYAYFEATVTTEPEESPSPSPSPSPSTSPSPKPSTSPTPKPKKERSCFEARVYEDLNANGRYDEGEPGLTWEIDWRRDGDNDWTEYNTYSDQKGMGGKVCVNDEPDITTKLRVKDWCKPTTAVEQKGKLEKKKTKYFEFGCTRTKQTTQKGDLPTQLPSTGASGQALLGMSASLVTTGIGLTLLQRRLRQ